MMHSRKKLTSLTPVPATSDSKQSNLRFPNSRQPITKTLAKVQALELTSAIKKALLEKKSSETLVNNLERQKAELEKIGGTEALRMQLERMIANAKNTLDKDSKKLIDLIIKQNQLDELKQRLGKSLEETAPAAKHHAQKPTSTPVLKHSSNNLLIMTDSQICITEKLHNERIKLLKKQVIDLIKTVIVDEWKTEDDFNTLLLQLPPDGFNKCKIENSIIESIFRLMIQYINEFKKNANESTLKQFNSVSILFTAYKLAYQITDDTVYDSKHFVSKRKMLSDLSDSDSKTDLSDSETPINIAPITIAQKVEKDQMAFMKTINFNLPPSDETLKSFAPALELKEELSLSPTATTNNDTSPSTQPFSRDTSTDTTDSSNSTLNDDASGLNQPLLIKTAQSPQRLFSAAATTQRFQSNHSDDENRECTFCVLV